MSSLGETVKNGETGQVTEAARMPDQIPDNPGTIVASTSIETIENILYKNWIWKSLFAIDSSMLPGHVFGTIKIHPKNCNDYITYIAAMFKTWTGSFHIRSRFMATFQFGGSFRVGFLPPKFSLEEVQNMPLTTLTAYPNVDLDPKNTDWIHFRPSDERNVLFHWMTDLASEDPQDFAGWFVFYVAAPLVVSGGTVTAVQMLIESAGDFQFAQLAPIASIEPTSQGWLDTANIDDILTDIGCDDNLQVTHLQINPITVKNLPTGFTLANTVGGTLQDSPVVL